MRLSTFQTTFLLASSSTLTKPWNLPDPQSHPSSSLPEDEHSINLLQDEPLNEDSSANHSLSQPWIRWRLRESASKWRKLTSNSEVLSIVEEGWNPTFGWCHKNECFYARKPIPALYQAPRYYCSRCKSALETRGPPPSSQKNKDECYELKHRGFILKTLSELEQRGVTRRAHPAEVNNIAPLGIALQKNGKQRLYYACTFLNRYMRHDRFKYESMRSHGREVFSTDAPNAVGWAIDLFSAFHFVDVATAAQKYLGFRDLNGTLYVFQGMPFGVSPGPRIFTILLRPAVAYWRTTLRANFVHLLDDFTGQEETLERAQNVSSQIVTHLQDLGFIIQDEKVVCGLAIMPRALGFKIDLPKQKFFLPDDRVQEIVEQARRILKQYQNHQPSFKCVQALYLISLAGKIISGDIAIGPRSRIFTRPLYAAVYNQSSLLRSSSSYDSLRRYIRLPQAAAAALACWANADRWNKGFSISMPHICLPPVGFLKSDASDSGWGSAITINRGVCEFNDICNPLVRNFSRLHPITLAQALHRLQQGLELAGLFSPFEADQNSTIREALGVLRSFRRAAYVLKGAHIHVHIDNQALAFCLGGAIPRYVQDQSVIPSDMDEIFKETLFPNLYGGSTGEDLQRIIEDTFNIADDAAFTFTPIWVPRALNERADLLSRAVFYDHSDYHISSRILDQLSKYWNIEFHLDVFASVHSSRLPRFYSKFYHPAAEGVDAFSMRWPSLPLWIHPPTSVIALTIEYARRQKAFGVLIVPQWARQLFYAKLLGRKGSRFPTPASQGGPRFIRDVFRIGTAEQCLSFNNYHIPHQSLPQGILWAIFIDFRFS